MVNFLPAEFVWFSIAIKAKSSINLIFYSYGIITALCVCVCGFFFIRLDVFPKMINLRLHFCLSYTITITYFSLNLISVFLLYIWNIEFHCLYPSDVCKIRMANTIPKIWYLNVAKSKKKRRILRLIFPKAETILPRLVHKRRLIVIYFNRKV